MSYIHLNQGTTTNHDRDNRWPTRLQARLHALGEIDTRPIHCIIHLVRGWRMGSRLYAVAKPYSGFWAIPCSLGHYHVSDAWIHSGFEPNSTTLISVSALTFCNRYKKTDGFICYWGWWLPNVLTVALIISISKLLKYFPPWKYSYHILRWNYSYRIQKWGLKLHFVMVAYSLKTFKDNYCCTRGLYGMVY